MIRQIGIVCLSWAWLWGQAIADDWPMYRGNAGRTGTTSESLHDKLVLSWERELPRLTPAFRHVRLQFDAGYEPVVAQDRLLIASSRTDSVTAYDAADGSELWRFQTNGPVRMAPAVWEDFVCFGSDDGYLYCVDLKTGSLHWKYQAVPSARRLLGNRRLISVWPVRGGPVVQEGVVYFAAGVWPFEGVFVYAMEITTGEVLWRNDHLSFRYDQQPHSTQAMGGLAPQGYLLINGEELIVPCSTAYPARLNCRTGELVEFHLPKAGRLPGSWFAAVDADTARDLRRGKIVFDQQIHRQRHEDKLYLGQGGVAGIRRMVRTARRTLKYDDHELNVDGTIHGMAVSNGRLFVTTDAGRIYCFTGKASNGQPRTEEAFPVTRWPLKQSRLSSSAEVQAEANHLLEMVSSRFGFAIVAGLDDGALVKAILTGSHFHVIAIDNDPRRVEKLREDLISAGYYGSRAAVIESDLNPGELPPYLATLIATERPDFVLRSNSRAVSLLESLHPYGGVAELGRPQAGLISRMTEKGYRVEHSGERTVFLREGSLPGASDYAGDWLENPDERVRFPLGVLWFDDSLSHFKRSPQPRFLGGIMVSRPKDWHAPRGQGGSGTDYPLLPYVLSDIYTGRILDASEQPELRATLAPSDPEKWEPNLYLPPRQKKADWNSQPEAKRVGLRRNPITGQQEPRLFPKTYGCDGGVDYGRMYTLRSGTAAFYDKAIESGTVFLSGPRSGCTNSIIPSGGLLNVPYFYDGCTCSYPLPVGFSMVAMPESYEQWSCWGESDLQPGTIRRIGLNLGAPGDRMTRSGTLWLDWPSVGGPSPRIRVQTIPEQLVCRYQHSLWMTNRDPFPWICASMAEGLERLVLNDISPGNYTVRLYFAEPGDCQPGERVQTISIEGRIVLDNFDIAAEAGNAMTGIVREVRDLAVDETLEIDLNARRGKTLLSGVELVKSDAKSPSSAESSR